MTTFVLIFIMPFTPIIIPTTHIIADNSHYIIEANKAHLINIEKEIKLKEYESKEYGKMIKEIEDDNNDVRKQSSHRRDEINSRCAGLARAPGNDTSEG